MLQHDYLNNIQPRRSLPRFVVSIRQFCWKEIGHGRFGEHPQVAEARAAAGLATVSPESDASGRLLPGDVATFRRRKRRSSAPRQGGAGSDGGSLSWI